MSRAGMSDLIARLRALTSAGTADYSVAGVTYWSNDQLQTILDQHRHDVTHALLTPVPEYDTSNTARYYDYEVGMSALEGASSGTTVWRLYYGTGATAGTASYTADYWTGRVRFTSDQAGSAIYARARSFDLNRAAAQVWRQKAADVWTAYQFSGDGQSFQRQQLYEHAMRMAAHYDAQAGPSVTQMIRSDLW